MMENISFKNELSDLLNKYKVDQEIGTLDILLVNYIISQLQSLKELNNRIEMRKIIKPSLETLNYE